MDNSNNLSLPYIAPSQAQKHITHNEAIRKLDTLVMLAVENDFYSTPPINTTDGTRFIVAQNSSGVWQNHENEIASWVDGAWEFATPQNGWLCWNEAEEVILVFSNSLWETHETLPDILDNISAIGVNSPASLTNRLTVSSDTTLLTHQGTDHRLALNKQSEDNTASIIFQNNFSARAEIGLAGEDNLQIKISNNGSNFITALSIDKDTGIVNFEYGAKGILNEQAFGLGEIINTDYIASRGADLFTNGTALLDNTYNLPAAFSVDKKVTPNLPASFEYEGYYSGVHTTSEFLPIDPNKIYKLQSYLYEEDYNHLQYMAVEMYGADKFAIVSQNSMRWFEGAFDSATTLTAPLTPGDTSISIADAAGWNETSASDWNRGVIIFEYKNSFGFKYDDFSRLIAADLFELGDVNKTTNTIALNKAFPVALANPDDANGTWPIGTKIANSRVGGTRKYAFYAGLRVPTLGDWYKTENYIGGIDKSGKNYSRNFSPGCAFCKISWLSSYSNRPGGYSAHPDSGANHKVRYAGISVIPAQNASLSNNADGSKSIHVAKLNSLGQWDYLTNTSPIIGVL